VQKRPDDKQKRQRPFDVPKKRNAKHRKPPDNVRQKRLDVGQRNNAEHRKRLDNVRQKKPLDVKQKKHDAKPN
jgi:hypothetical protein